MTALNALERVLKSYNDYYNVTRDGISPPFIAEAAFHSNSTQYFLSKKVQLAHANSNEYVFFAVSDSLDQGEVEELARLAWDLGMERVSPHKNHRNTDVSLVILAENITPQARATLLGRSVGGTFKRLQWRPLQGNWLITGMAET